VNFKCILSLRARPTQQDARKSEGARLHFRELEPESVSFIDFENSMPSYCLPEIMHIHS
jgi:hypothetical protein